MFHASARMIAQRKMIIFGVLIAVAVMLGVVSGFAMASIPHQDFAWWVMLGCSFIAILTFVWSMLGFLFALFDYRNETSTLYRQEISWKF